jgi:WD40 repeat protein
MGAAPSASFQPASASASDEPRVEQLSKELQASAEQVVQLQARLQASARELDECNRRNALLLDKIRDLTVHCQSQNADICEQNDRLRSEMLAIEARLVATRMQSAVTDVPSFSSCSVGIVNGKKRRDDGFLRDLFNRHKDSSGGLSVCNLVEALRDAHALISPKSALDASDVIQQFDMTGSGSLNFAGFKQAVNHPDELQLWLDERQLPLAADALRPLFGPDDQLRKLSQLSPAAIEMSAAAISCVLPDTMKQLRQELHDAFAIQQDLEAEMKADPSKFNEYYKMACGSVADFHRGLTGRVGMPHLDFRKAMRLEHCERAGCDKEFKSSNYGIVTSPKSEWSYVVDNIACPDMGHQRRLVSIKDLMQKHVCKHAKLCEEEVIAVVLYSGPMFQVYNTILRQYPQDAFAIFRDGGNLFPTTIFVLVSAIQKLCRFTRIPEGTLLYRGLGGKTDLPDIFFQSDEQGCSGYAEWGFLSTTADREVALGYSGVKDRRPKAMVMVIETSSIDRGADISELSQYPGEQEFLYLPCSFIQKNRQGSARVQVVDGALVSFVSVRVNLNIKTQTVEELREQKKCLHLVSARSLLSEVKYDLTDWVEARPQQGLELTSSAEDMSKFASDIVAKFEDVVQKHECCDASVYANDEDFRVMINEILDSKAAAVEAKRWQQTRLSLRDHDATVAACACTLQGHSRDVLCVAFHPSKPILATGSGDGTARLWRLNFDGTKTWCVATLQGHGGNVCFVAFHPSQPFFATGSGDTTAKLWQLNCDAEGASCIATLQGHKMTVWCCCFHPRLPFFATCSDDKTAKWWLLHSDYTAASCAATLEEHSKLVSSVAFHPTARILATGSDDMTAKLWLLNSDYTVASCVATLKDHSNWVSYVTFHPSEPFLATCSYDNSAKLWRLNCDGTEATCVATLQGHSNCVVTAAFHPTAPILATGSSDGTAMLWRRNSECTEATCVATLEGHRQGVWSVAFHPSAPFLATGSADNTAKLWH